MTTSQRPAPGRSHARSTRARILAAACEELGRNPKATLDELARSAGVARRTIYGHFPSREALVSALADEARRSIDKAVAAAGMPGDDSATALVRLALAVWAVGDRYRMLISLARCDISGAGVRAALAPARTELTASLRRGQRDGTLSDHVPAPVLARTVEALTLALIEERNSPEWSGLRSETAAAVAMLLACGVVRGRAESLVQRVVGDAP